MEDHMVDWIHHMTRAYTIHEHSKSKSAIDRRIKTHAIDHGVKETEYNSVLLMRGIFVYHTKRVVIIKFMAVLIINF